jgi:hypothetical protein
MNIGSLIYEANHKFACSDLQGSYASLFIVQQVLLERFGAITYEKSFREVLSDWWHGTKDQANIYSLDELTLDKASGFFGGMRHLHYELVSQGYETAGLLYSIGQKNLADERYGAALKLFRESDEIYFRTSNHLDKIERLCSFAGEEYPTDFSAIRDVMKFEMARLILDICNLEPEDVPIQEEYHSPWEHGFRPHW